VRCIRWTQPPHSRHFTLPKFGDMNHHPVASLMAFQFAGIVPSHVLCISATPSESLTECRDPVVCIRRPARRSKDDDARQQSHYLGIFVTCGTSTTSPIVADPKRQTRRLISGRLTFFQHPKVTTLQQNIVLHHPYLLEQKIRERLDSRVHSPVQNQKLLAWRNLILS